MTDSRYALRPEAGPVPHNSLNRSQREALKAIVAALSQAVDDARSSQSNESAGMDHAVEADRVSRLFFVSGQPGSGKSSLYVTLRALVGTDRRHETIREEYRKGLPNISHLEGKTRWLEPLDLEVAVDEEENLLAAVLVRISGAINYSSLSVSKPCREAMEQLEELANDIGIAWDGNLKARAGSLDPDGYSQETIRAQRSRLSTNSRLRPALDTILKNKCYGLSGEELFVLPIDDFYLKPKASLELLRLLRMISVPRLFFLIMGDIKTVEALFFEKALADWTAIAGPQVLATLRERTKQDVLPRAREMRARYLRKLIPAGQRATIEWTEWHEALRFRPPLAIGSDPQLCRLLSSVSIPRKDGSHGLDLLNYLVSPRLEEDALCETTGDLALPDPKNGTVNTLNKFREAYSGLQVLDATPREILDLWMHLRKHLEADIVRAESSIDCNDTKHLWALVQCALPAMEEQDFLTEEDQEILRFVFPTSVRDDLQFGTDRLRLTQKSSPWRLGPGEQDVVVRRHLDWRLGILRRRLRGDNQQNDVNDDQRRGSVSQNGYDNEDERYLPPRLAAWVILLHDLAWKSRSGSVLENLVERLCREIGNSPAPVESTKSLSTRHAGWAWYKTDGQWVHFPLPRVDTFRQLDRFLKVWSYRLLEDLEHLESKKREAGSRSWRIAVAQRWRKAAVIATGPEDRYKDFVVSLGKTREMQDDVEWNDPEVANKLFGDRPFLGDWVAWSAG